MRKPRKLSVQITASVVAQAIAVTITFLEPLNAADIERCLDAIAAYFGYSVTKEL